MSDPRLLIEELRVIINDPVQYERLENELDCLKMEIWAQEMDKYYRDHPEETDAHRT